MSRWLIFVFLTTGLCCAQTPPPNWSGQYSPCERHSELLSGDHVDLGVRISTTNAILAAQFGRAMDFWKSVVDLDWHETQSQECAIQLVDGAKDLFDNSGVAARSQYPDRAEFQGWIAFNPASKLTGRDMFIVCVHEIGHLLGLPHNPSAASVMYFFNLDDAVSLDAADISALALKHRLRSGILARDRSAAGRWRLDLDQRDR